MKAYRIYFVGPNRRLQLGESFQARDDASALPRAKVLTPPGRAAELWEGGRFVGLLSDEGQFRGG